MSENKYEESNNLKKIFGAEILEIKLAQDHVYPTSKYIILAQRNQGKSGKEVGRNEERWKRTTKTIRITKNIRLSSIDPTIYQV